MTSTTTGALVQGHVEAGWGKVADAFRANFDGNPGEVGAACCVYVGGQPVVDLWGGLADSETNRPWNEDTIVQIASTTKGATAICAHILAQRGELDLDAPVVKYWAEFGANGKDQIPVRWLLSHQAGLPVIDTPLTFEEALAWDPVIRALEAQRPLWQPGTEHVYHSMTFGYLVGEIVRRISGKSLGTFFADEVARPLKLHAWIGLPEAQDTKVARLHYAKPFTLEDVTAGMIETTGLDADTVTAWIRAVWGADSVQARAGELGGAFDNASGYFTQRAWRAAEVPAANGVADARSMARMYAATVSDVDGIRLLESGHIEEGDRGPDRQDANARAAPGAEHPGRSLLLHVAWVLAGLPSDADGGAEVVRPSGLRWFDRVRRPRCRGRLRVRHESVVVPDRRTAGGEPGRRGRRLSRLTDTVR